MNLWSLLQRAADLWPQRPATIEDGRTATWIEMQRDCARLAHTFAALGLEQGQRVAILEANSVAYLEAYFAAAGIGAVLCPLNTRLAPRELATILDEAQPLLFLVGRGFEERAQAALEQANSQPRVLALPGAMLAGATAWPERRSEPTRFQPAPVPSDGLAQLYFTSGTTGRSKGVMLTHGNVASHALAAVAELGLNERDVWGHFAPLFHLADAWATFAVTWVGGCHVLQREFEAERTLACLAREKVTLTNLVPTMLVRVVEAASGGSPEEGLGLRLLLSGGAPIAPETVARIEEVLGCPYAQTYGMTETSPYLTISLLDSEARQLPREEQRALRAKTGRPFLGIELEVVDDEDRSVPRDGSTVGEIRVRGLHVSPGYWNRPEETAAAFRHGWLYTGDLAVQDARGFVDIVDRKKDMILTGGESVYSIEVENALIEFPGVLEAAVFGREDSEWGERVVAAVVPRPGHTPTVDALLDHCRERLAGYKVPREVHLLAELPRTGSGKISKRLLRES